MSKTTIDEIFRASGFRNISESPASQKNDDLSSGKNFYDHVLQSISHHDDVLRSAFKKFEFYGVVLQVNKITNRQDLISRTSRAFMENLFTGQVIGNSETIPLVQEMSVHIPEITGLLLQVTVREVLQSMEFQMGRYTFEETMAMAGGDSRIKDKKTTAELIFQRKVSRFPRFYAIGSNRAAPLEIWKVRYPDKNFLYYGFADNIAKPAEEIKRVSGDIMSIVNNIIEKLEANPLFNDAE